MNDEILSAYLCSKAKIEWANQHIKNTKTIIDRICSPDGYVIRPQFDAEAGKYGIYVGPEKGMPPTLSLSLGDAIHNLNSVGDFLYSGLARAVNPSLGSKVTLPRHKTFDNLIDKLDAPKGHDAAIQKAFPKVRGFIVDTIKPYDTGDGDLVWTLNKLDNINKHRLLLATISIAKFGDPFIVRVKGMPDTKILLSNTTVETHSPLFLLGGIPGEPEIDHDAKATIDVIFNEGDFFRAQPIFPTLVNLSNAMSEIVESFAKEFL